MDSAAPQERMQALVEMLSADDFQGRRTGTPGGRAAAGRLAAHLAWLGAAVTLDDFAIIGAVKQLSSTPTLRWRSAHGDRKLVHRRDFAEHPASAHSPEPLAGPLGSVWVVAETIEQVPDGARGALLPRGTDEAGWMPKMIAGPRARPMPILSVRTGLHRELAGMAHEGQSWVEASVPLETVDVTGTNVLGVFRASAPGGVSILLTAHFDGVGDDPRLRFPAAADNASGVAVIVEAAHQLSRTLRPGAGLAVALLDGEEAGAHGSAHHAPQVPPGTFVINLDGAARLGAAAAVEAGGPAMPLLRALDRAGRLAGVPLEAKAMPSDNRRYAAAGLPSAGIGMGIPGYQTPAETPDRVEAATLLAALRLVAGMVHELAGLPTPVAMT
jgi:hypothetical protein